VEEDGRPAAAAARAVGEADRGGGGGRGDGKVGPRGAGGATQEGAGRAGGERHGGFLCLVGGRSRRRGEGRRNGTGEDRGGSEPRKQQEERSGVVVVSLSLSGAAQIRGGLEAGAFSRRAQRAAVRYLPHADVNNISTSKD